MGNVAPEVNCAVRRTAYMLVVIIEPHQFMGIKLFVNFQVTKKQKIIDIAYFWPKMS